MGGKFNPGESPEDCVIREVKEESGLTIISPKMRGIIAFPNFDREHDWYVFIFTAGTFSGRLTDSNEGHLDWIPNKKLFSLNLWEGDKIFIEWLSQNKFFSAKFNYENGIFNDYTVFFY